MPICVSVCVCVVRLTQKKTAGVNAVLVCRRGAEGTDRSASLRREPGATRPELRR